MATTRDTQDPDQGANIALPPSPTPQQAPAARPNAGSNITTPTSARPRSLPGAAAWALPLSESAAKYRDLAARPRATQTRSASASRAGEPLEGQSDPGLVRTRHPAPNVTRPTAKGAKKEAAAELRRRERDEALGEN